MKKTTKAKLLLDKTTVRVLAMDDLQDVVGGTSLSCAGTCNTCPQVGICNPTQGCPTNP